ncbi:MAG: hypothetical protein Q8Q09_17735 [Deltaproteobacteria bacterium]|nr:hypothetical protein [Deltaproteobacteria bacterium]
MTMIKSIPGLLASLALSVTLIHCGEAPPAYSEVQAILTSSCAVGNSSCHNSASGMARFPGLAAAMTPASIVSVNSQQIAMPLVTPGSLERSYLWHKINGTMSTLSECRAMGADCGQRMPMVGGGELSMMQLDVIRRWILAGAPSR